MMRNISFSSMWKVIRSWTALGVILSMVLSPSTTYAQAFLDLPAPGSMVLQSQAFVPVVLRAIKVHPDEPLVFDFVVDNGNTGLEGADLKAEIERIAKYFLATLTIPQKDLWVNLSPYEKDRIIADEFGRTEMGRDMLAQDYILKQLSSSLVNPDSELGRKYWDKLYAKAQEALGTTEIPMDTFNKVWIVPEKAVVYEKDNAAVLGETRLKLMMEEDYLAMNKSAESSDWVQRMHQQAADPDHAGAAVSSQIMREVVLPVIEEEVNNGKNFAPLRQMFSAIILATWYKEAVKDSLLSRMYEDQKKVAGINIQDPNMREKIFEQYVAAYKKGVFNFIRDDQDPLSGEILPRKYFSGGVNAAAEVDRKRELPPGDVPAVGKVFTAPVVGVKPTEASAAPAAESLPPGSSVEFDEDGQPTSGNSAMAAGQYARTPISEEMVAKLASAPGLPAAFQQEVLKKEISGEEGDLALLLLDIKQDHLFSDALKAGLSLRDFLAKAYVVSRREDLRKLYDLLIRYIKDPESISFVKGKDIEQPESVIRNQSLNAEFLEAEEEGLRQSLHVAQGLLGGGVGDRFGLSTAKLSVVHSLIEEKSFLQIKIEEILARQRRVKDLIGTDVRIPFVIMTSDGTHQQIVDLLKKNDSFGMAGYTEVVPGEPLPEKLGQIILMKQEGVPTFFLKKTANGDPQADLVFSPQTGLSVKPGGHGAFNDLLKMTGVADRLVQEGFEDFLWDQDTNRVDENIKLALTGYFYNKNLQVLMTAIPRIPGEPTGAAVSLVDKVTGTKRTGILEYALFGPSGFQDVKAQGSDFSAFLGTINVSIQHLGSQAAGRADAFDAAYEDTHGTIVTLNPKPGKEARKEALKQDDLWGYAPDRVGFAVLGPTPQYGFAAAKNGTPSADEEKPKKHAIEAEQEGRPNETLGYSERMSYAANRQKLEAVCGMTFTGAGVKGEAREVQTVLGPLHYNYGANVVFDPNFAPTLKELQSKIQGGVMGQDTTLYVKNSRALTLKGLTLNRGAFILDADNEKDVVINDALVDNEGWETRSLSLGEVNDTKTPDPLLTRMRGYKLVKHAAAEVVIRGAFDIQKVFFDGKVSLENHSGKKFDLNELKARLPQDADGRMVLKNVRIVVNAAGEASVLQNQEGGEQAMKSTGGVDFGQTFQGLQIERTGNGIQVHVDPAMMQRIQTGGFEGLAPVVIDVFPARGVLSALGIQEPQAAGTT